PVPEPRPPVGAGAPRRALENQPGAEALGQPRIAPEVSFQRRVALRPPQHIERGEIGQLELLQKDERGLDAAVGQEKLVAELREAFAVSRHDPQRYSTRGTRSG